MMQDVSTALIGARTVQQLEDTVEAVNILKKFTPELDQKIESVLNNRPSQSMDFRKWAPLPSRR